MYVILPGLKLGNCQYQLIYDAKSISPVSSTWANKGTCCRVGPASECSESLGGLESVIRLGWQPEKDVSVFEYIAFVQDVLRKLRMIRYPDVLKFKLESGPCCDKAAALDLQRALKAEQERRGWLLGCSGICVKCWYVVCSSACCIVKGCLPFKRSFVNRRIDPGQLQIATSLPEDEG